MIVGVFGGMVWGGISGWLKASRGGHEVIATLMLNFIATAIASFVALYVLKDSNSQNPETEKVAARYPFHQFAFFAGAPVTVILLLAIIAIVATFSFLSRTSFGFEIRAVGLNLQAAKVGGINTNRVQFLVFCLAGGLAGLAGVDEVLGNAGRYRVGFSPDYGFLGIAVALLGRTSVLGLVSAALFFAAIHKGSANLDLELEHVTRDVSLIAQAFVILMVCAYPSFQSKFLTKER